MGKGLPRSLKHADKNAVILKRFEFDDLAMTVDGATGVGDGQVVAGDFPEGNILFLGATAYVTFAGPGGDAGLVDTWAGDYSVGTTADTGDDLTGTDADIIDSTAIAAATAEVSPRTRGVGATGAIFDNTDGSLEVNLNLLIDDVDISADSIAFLVSGEIIMAYAVMGND